jgi:hypothetical protein
LIVKSICFFLHFWFLKNEKVLPVWPLCAGAKTARQFSISLPETPPTAANTQASYSVCSVLSSQRFIASMHDLAN